jgi:hypothetical protein
VVKERFGKVWKTTAKGKAFVDFHNTLVKKPHSIYFWLNGATNPSPKLIDDAGKFLKANHDFYSLEAPNITKVLVRFNSGYTETISLEPRHVVCGLIYSADYARLAVAQKKLVDLGDISKRESETPAFLYAHIISRMKHSVADLDHSLKGKFVKWSDEVGIADPMNRSINFYRWQTRRFIRSFQKSNTIFSTIALLRCIESSYLAEDDEKAKQFMSGPVREIETKIVKVEFSENNERETMLNDYNIIKNGIFGKMSQKRP